MGSGLSLFLSNVSSCYGGRDLLKPCLGDLPENCVAMILKNLDPVEICKFSKLNKAFLSASFADFVWESKLAPGYKLILEKILGDFPQNLRKKYVFDFLTRINSFDHGTKKVWLDEQTGGLSLCIAAKGLLITGIDDRRYWNRIPTDESRFASVAYLRQIWWVEIDGEIDFPFPPGSYSVFFRLQLGKPGKRFGWRVCDTRQIHGWDIKPARFQVSTGDGQHSSSQCMLKEQGYWRYYHAGDFVVGKSKSSSTKLRFSMTQIDCTHTKGGLCLDHVIVYPSSCKDQLKQI
ncbi:F-box protein PP2-A11 [Cardamine amara subsp. amara]|uniref:F-box protein PP2-A11 n=1 Tax=Cardamine amara subsp. amara TaxID=228776 RepID=A0ABD0Z5Z5_CARAN